MSTTIATLRDCMPIRALTFAESLRLAELQASKFLALAGITDGTVPETAITALPRVQVERMSPAPVSGATQWSHGRWLIILNGSESRGRQRFSLAHEFKHVLDNPFIDTLYPAQGDMSSGERAEQVCDYFAGCLLMPRLWVKRAWTGGQQSPRSLARQFDVSAAAMSVRLRQIGLVHNDARCEGVAIARVAA
jgi:Zn-dependent peptidase ImmA (M78 family)